jgi:hypothetical protein
MKKKIRDKMI